MQDDTIINGLKQKRAELAGQFEQVRKDLAAIDGALIAFGYHDVKSIPAKNPRRRPPLFKPGQLMALVGEAERAGCADNASIAAWIIRERDMDPELYQRVRNGVKDCRKPKPPRRGC
jgi:hypothetical protein